MKPYYTDGLRTIYHGDCEDFLPSICDVDLVFTSPPYNLGMHPTGSGSGMHGKSLAASPLANGYSGEYHDAMPQDEYDQWQTQIVWRLWNTLSNTGAIFYNHKPRPMNGGLHLPLIYGNLLPFGADGNLPLRQIIIWDRGTGMNFSESFFLPKSEWIIVWAKPAWRLTSRSASQVGDVWRVRPEQSTDHPAPFPVTLPAMAITATAPRLILDPFMGSGTTLRAAKNAGIAAIGIDQSEAYCELAAKRLERQVAIQESIFG